MICIKILKMPKTFQVNFNCRWLNLQYQSLTLRIHRFVLLLVFMYLIMSAMAKYIKITRMSRITSSLQFDLIKEGECKEKEKMVCKYRDTTYSNIVPVQKHVMLDEHACSSRKVKHTRRL